MVQGEGYLEKVIKKSKARKGRGSSLSGLAYPYTNSLEVRIIK
jgi:hypothetical protein